MPNRIWQQPVGVLDHTTGPPADGTKRIHPIVRLGFVTRLSAYPVFLILYGVHLSIRGSANWILACLAIVFLLWPLLGWVTARYARDSKSAELRNFLVDSFLIGGLIPLTGYSIWPSMAGLMGLVAAMCSVGGRRLTLEGLGGLAVGIGLAAALSDVPFAISDSSPLTQGMSAMALLIYFTGFGLSSYAQARRVVSTTNQVRQQSVLLAERSTQLETALKAADGANAAKGAFLAVMSHELRTPLNAIIGFSNILLRNGHNHLNPREAKFVTRIAANGAHLLTLIDGVLDLSKIDAGHINLEITTVDVAALSRDVVKQMEPIAHAKHITLHLEIAEYAMLQADRVRLKQILFNLLGNAIKFTHVGSVTLRVTADVETRMTTRIDVADTGVGIAPDRLSAVFDAFQQASQSTTREFGGTGLGLTITRTLAELMGWEISATSTVGAGSVFSILTAPDANRATTGTHPIPTPPGGNRVDPLLRKRLVHAEADTGCLAIAG